jgi:hypothetical protein
MGYIYENLEGWSDVLRLRLRHRLYQGAIMIRANMGLV